MDNSYLTNPIVFLIQVLFGLYTAVVVVRFLLQLTRADFYNPVSQLIVKLTSPVLNPLRRIVPGYGGVDFASVLLAWGLKSLELALILLVSGFSFQALGPLLWAWPELIGLVFTIFIVAILIRAILSWLGPQGYNPAEALLRSLTRPVLHPIQRVVPPVSGLDLSPMVAIIGLMLLKMLLLPPLQALTASPFR
jgi:YggT family protein